MRPAKVRTAPAPRVVIHEPKHQQAAPVAKAPKAEKHENRGQSAKFPPPQLIPAWQEGIPGMKVGGRRQLVCPPELAYGPTGGGHRLSGKTLVFVIDLLGVG